MALDHGRMRDLVEANIRGTLSYYRNDGLEAAVLVNALFVEQALLRLRGLKEQVDAEEPDGESPKPWVLGVVGALKDVLAEVIAELEREPEAPYVTTYGGRNHNAPED